MSIFLPCKTIEKYDDFVAPCLKSSFLKELVIVLNNLNIGIHKEAIENRLGQRGQQRAILKFQEELKLVIDRYIPYSTKPDVRRCFRKLL